MESLLAYTAAGGSIVHRVDARVKMVLLLAYTATLFAVARWSGLAACAVVLCALVAAGRLPLGRMLGVADDPQALQPALDAFFAARKDLFGAAEAVSRHHILQDLPRLADERSALQVLVLARTLPDEDDPVAGVPVRVDDLWRDMD